MKLPDNIQFGKNFQQSSLVPMHKKTDVYTPDKHFEVS